MWFHPYRANPRTSTAVWNAKSLMQIQVTDIRSEVTRATEPDKSVHVRPVHIDLASMLMDDVTNFSDSFFEYAMSRRIGDH